MLNREVVFIKQRMNGGERFARTIDNNYSAARLGSLQTETDQIDRYSSSSYRPRLCTSSRSSPVSRASKGPTNSVDRDIAAKRNT